MAATTNLARALQWLFGFMLVAVLVACGGGGGGSPSPDPGPGTNTGTVGPGSNTGTVGPGSNTGVQPGGGGGTSLELGVEFRVNTTTALAQANADVARFSDGGFVVVWESQSLPSSPNGVEDPRKGIYAQRYGADGAPVGGETRITDDITGSQFSAARVATLADGGYLVMWNIRSSSTGANQMQRIRADGSRGFFRENVAMNYMIGLRDGGYVLLSSTTLQRYGADDAAIGEPQALSTDTLYRGNPSIAALQDGGFVVAWHGSTSANVLPDRWGTLSTDIYIRRFNADATPAGPDTNVTQRNGGQMMPSITGLQGGGYALAWMSVEGQSLNTSPYPAGYVKTQAFRADGSPTGEASRVDPAMDIPPRACPGRTPSGFTPDCPPYPWQGVASVAGLDDGGYVVGFNTPDRPGRVYARRYDGQATPVGAVTRVTSDTPFEKGQWGPSVVSMGNGGFAIIWDSLDEDGELGGIYARRWGPTGLR